MSPTICRMCWISSPVMTISATRAGLRSICRNWSIPESVRDYFAANVWLNNKWDWPGKNWTIWKTTKVDPDNPYADGRWRLCFYDLDFGGVSGVEDIGTNTMAEDNYKKYGLLDKKTANPLVKNVCLSDEQ